MIAWVAAILIASILLQLAAALVAILQVRQASRFRFAWVCVSIALFLMIERRVEPLILLQPDQDPHWVNNGTGLLISMLMAAGMFGLRSLFQTLRQQDDLLRQLAATDPLTRLANRRSLYDLAQREIRLSQRTGKPLALFMIDLDYFKQVNDRFGHSAGDAALVQVADKLRTCLRSVDHIARWGGEEFVALLPDLEADGALEVAERVRREIEGAAQSQVRLTVSIGVTVYRPEEVVGRGDLFPILIDEADCALYLAKQEGRNCIRFYAPRSAAETHVSGTGEVNGATRRGSPGAVG